MGRIPFLLPLKILNLLHQLSTIFYCTVKAFFHGKVKFKLFKSVFVFIVTSLNARPGAHKENFAFSLVYFSFINSNQAHNIFTKNKKEHYTFNGLNYVISQQYKDGIQQKELKSKIDHCFKTISRPNITNVQCYKWLFNSCFIT